MLPDDPNDQARFFYLALLGMAVAVWVLRDYRKRMGQAAQHAAIWALIFVGVVIAIGFKDTLTSQLFNDQPQAIDKNTIALRRGGDGHFYATLAVNDVDVRFVIDTGASSVVLSDADARRVGIDPGALAFIIRTQTANGVIMNAPVRLDSVQFGDFVDYDVPATVNGGELSESLLGMSYLDLYSSLRREGNKLFLSR